MAEEPTVASQIIAWILGVGIFVVCAAIFNFIYNFLSQPYEHSESVKRMLEED